jgi:2-hydroxy-3-keto-5-methylthiopentenyl-1-phosphate phosphatase
LIYNNINQQIGLFDYLKNDYKSISTFLAGKIKIPIQHNSFEWIDENNGTAAIVWKSHNKGIVPAFDQIVMRK